MRIGQVGVRVHVAINRYCQLDAGDVTAPGTLDRAQKLLILAHVLTWRWRRRVPIVFCGPSGSGKSTLGVLVASWSRWPHYGSDPERKQIAGADFAAHSDEHLYGPGWNQRVYTRLGQLAAGVLTDGASGVIVNASCRHEADRLAFEAELPEACEPIYIECRAPAEDLKARIRRRTQLGLSDAVPELVDDQLRDLADRDFAGALHVVLDTAGTQQETYRRLGNLLAELV